MKYIGTTKAGYVVKRISDRIYTHALVVKYEDGELGILCFCGSPLLAEKAFKARVSKGYTPEKLEIVPVFPK